MKRWSILASLAVLAPMTVMAEGLTVPHLNGKVTIDGRLDEPMWVKAAHLPYTAFIRWVDNAYSNDPTAFQMSLFHDGKTLYVSLMSHDRFVESDAVPENSDGLYSLSFLTRSGKLKHYRLRWAANPPIPGGELRNSGQWSAHLLGPFDKPKRRGGGYVFEFAIPLSAIGHKPGDTVPFNIIVNDRDGKPRVPYHTPGAEFARFAWGNFDNDNRAGYKTLKLEP